MMYLTKIPFPGSIIATVESEIDPRLPELIDRYAKGEQTKVVNDADLDALFVEFENSMVTEITTIDRNELAIKVLAYDN